MISKNELMKRVAERKRELAAKQEQLTAFRNRLTGFVSEIKSNPVIHGLIKNLSVWKEIEALLSGGDSGER